MKKHIIPLVICFLSIISICLWFGYIHPDNNKNNSKIRSIKAIKQDLSEFISLALNKSQLPGLAIAIIENGQLIYVKGFGSTNILNGHSIDANTIFGIGSITKPLTTLLIAKLVDQGTFKWSDKAKAHSTQNFVSETQIQTLPWNNLFVTVQVMHLETFHFI